jgi:hypothetical protein
MEALNLPLEAEASLLTLAHQIAEIRIRNEERERATHKRFNVFATLLKPNDEVRLHTRFIHCLQNPHGLHDCGPLFLNLFLETLQDSDLPLMDHDGPVTKRELPDKVTEWLVSKETQKLGHGQLDILLESASYGIAIEIFETGHTLLATLGYPVFDPVAKPAELGKADEIFYCTASGTNGRGIYTQEGFVVLQGSIGRKENVNSIKGTSDERLREKLLEQKVMHVEGDNVIFDKDHLFRAPSAAAVPLMGSTANGWTTWRTAGNKTLDAVIRQPATA